MNTSRHRYGHYEIVAPMGAGGMGEVFRARDTRLDREVALKLLPEAFARDAERLLRFEREAKLLAALNHPNIAGVYGLEEVDGRRVLVMELVEGEDLSQRLKRGALPVDEALAAAIAMAEALEAAHDRGIVHRDLKPANVRVSPAGLVKVLDFGLAKAVFGDGGGSSPAVSRSPTLASPTQAGVILGTAAYMSPEQARGKPVDKRADIWAFGVVLYEMLTGHRLFEGETVSDTLAAVLKTEPDFTALPRETPEAVRKVLRRCLERDPKQRLHDIADARIELEDAQAPGEPTAAAARRRSPPSSRRTQILAGVALLALGVLAGAAALRVQVAKEPQSPHFTLRRLTELPGAEEYPAISPDGRQIVYTTAAGGNPDIYLLRVGGDRAINLTPESSADDEQPAISPDGETIAFRSSRDGGGLYLMGLTGESVRRVTSAGYEPAWSPDGRSLAYSTEAVRDVYSRGIVAELWTVELATGRTTRLLKGDAVQPRWSPDGRRIAYWSNVRGQRDLFTVAADGGDPVAVLHDAATDWSPEWSPDGEWLYFSSDRGGGMDLWRIRMDAQSGRPSGAPRRVTTGVRSLAGARFSRDGRRLALMAYDRTADVLLHDLDPTAATAKLRTTLEPRSAHWCAPSPDAAWLACASMGTTEDLVLLRSDGAELRRLTNDAAKDRHASWSPDGKTIAFGSTRSGQWGYWSIQQDGSGLKPLIDIGEMGLGVWLPGGREMVVVAHARDLYRIDLSVVSNLQTARKLTPPVKDGIFEPLAWLTVDRAAGAETDLSADEIRAYGTWDVTAGAYKRLQVTPAGRSFGAMTDWLPDGRRLVLRGREGCLLFDAATETARLLMACGASDLLKTSRDGRTLLIEREVLDSDVWMLELP